MFNKQSFGIWLSDNAFVVTWVLGSLVLTVYDIFQHLWIGAMVFGLVTFYIFFAKLYPTLVAKPKPHPVCNAQTGVVQITNLTTEPLVLAPHATSLFNTDEIHLPGIHPVVELPETGTTTITTKA